MAIPPSFYFMPLQDLKHLLALAANSKTRDVPFRWGFSLGGITILLVYILLQTVTQGVLGAEMVSFKDAPLAAVAEKIVGPMGATVLLMTAAISCFGCVSADIMATPRSLFAGANDGMFPKFLGKVHRKFATPHFAVTTYGSLIFIFSISGGFKQLAILASAAILLVYLGVTLATVKMRTTKQDTAGKSFRCTGRFDSSSNRYCRNNLVAYQPEQMGNSFSNYIYCCSMLYLFYYQKI